MTPTAHRFRSSNDVAAFAILWGAVVLAEPVGVELLAGFGLILVSLALVLGLRVPRGPVAGRRRTAARAPDVRVASEAVSG